VPSQVTASGAFDGMDPVHPHPGVTPADVIRASAASRSAVAVVSAASGCVQHNDRYETPKAAARSAGKVLRWKALASAALIVAGSTRRADPLDTPHE